MFVPNAENAFVDIRKLTDYCLNPDHEIGKYKAQVFESALDPTIEDAEELSEALFFAVKNNEAQVGKFDKFVQRYTVDFEIVNGNKKATVKKRLDNQNKHEGSEFNDLFYIMKNNFKLFDVVALTTDLPEDKHLKGQVGTIVEVYNDGEAFEVEFVNTKGETYGLLTLYPKQLMLLHYAPTEFAV